MNSYNEKQYYVFYKISGTELKRIYDGNEFKNITIMDRDYNDYGKFELMKKYEANDEGLRNYYRDFTIFCKDLFDVENPRKNFPTIKYSYYYNHAIAVENTFMRLDGKIYNNMFPIITFTEYKWFEKTNNGGLLYCKEGLHDSYGFDFSSFYPRNLSDIDFIFPISQGIEKTIEKLPLKSKNIEFGLYRVKIISEDINFLKVFNFSSDNTYTSDTVKFCILLKEHFDIKLELIIDNKPNFLYFEKTIDGRIVFGKWFDSLYNLRKKYPKNILIKHLMSSLWSSLSRNEKITKTEQQIIDEKLSIDYNEDSNADYIIYDFIQKMNSECYFLTKKSNSYKYNFRIKSFLTSFGRIKMAKVALMNLKSLIRIQTDNLVLSTPTLKKTIDNLIVEEKTTGLIHWKNVNNYFHVCSNCKLELKYEIYKQHSCNICKELLYELIDNICNGN
jgi:hypothetical protein